LRLLIVAGGHGAFVAAFRKRAEIVLAHVNRQSPRAPGALVPGALLFARPLSLGWHPRRRRETGHATLQARMSGGPERQVRTPGRRPRRPSPVRRTGYQRPFCKSDGVNQPLQRQMVTASLRVTVLRDDSHFGVAPEGPGRRGAALRHSPRGLRPAAGCPAPESSSPSARAFSGVSPQALLVSRGRTHAQIVDRASRRCGHWYCWHGRSSNPSLDRDPRSS
jgi:hypothetical protein